MKKSQIFAAFIGLVALVMSAQLSLDLQLGEVNIPVTGQTLGVILVAYFLPKHHGFFVVFLYLLLALVGLPILADWSGGVSKFKGGSAGFLLGFLAAAFYVGWQSYQSKVVNIWSAIWLNVVATIFILVFGNTWLIFNYGLEKGLQYGFFPFWPGAIAKVLVGALVMCFFEKYKSREGAV